jgi:poly-gamma-glutamate synthesis protein (capsule biosynthesis protein)
MYRGKPVFYGLGNFVWDAPEGWADAFSPATKERMARLGTYALRTREGYPRLPFHPDGRMTAIARCRFRDGQLEWCGFVPCRLRPDGRVAPLDAGEDDGRRVVDFVQTMCDDLDLPVAVAPDPDEHVGPFTGVRVAPRRA